MRRFPYGSLLVVCLLSVSALFAQFETSEVLGTVRDPSNAALPGATVTLTNQQTGVTAKTTTNENGEYDFFDVQVGVYTVKVEHAGFSAATASDIRVNVNVRQRVDMVMQVGEVSNSVTVSAAASTLTTDSSEHSQVIGTEATVELPLNGRDPTQLALLATNTVESPIAVSFGPTGTPREGAFNVNGMRSTYNFFLLDGMDNTAYGTSNQGYSAQVIQLSPDALAEFRVITSNYSAEYGRVGGAVVNAVMRSGTNQFHGTAYEFLRNTDLNAAGYDFGSSNFVKPPLQRNQFGVTIGGPLIKNRLFFFADYEGLRQLQHYFNYDSIPDLNDRDGILPVPVYDNLTKTLYPANTPIPISSLNPFAAQVLSQLPLPNAGTGRSSNLGEPLLIRDYGDKYDAKVDGQINDRMSAFLRFSQRKDLDYYEPDIPGPSGGDGNGYIHTIDQNASAGYTWTVTPASVLEARFGFDHVLAGKEPAYLGGPSMEALYGIPGLPTTPSLTGGLNSQNISGFSQLGRQTSNPQFQNPTSFDPKINYSMVAGRHSIKFGYEYLAVRTEILDVNPLYGEDQYTGQFSKPTCAELGQAAGCPITSDATSYNLADFIFGTPSIINLGNDAVVNLRQHINSLYVQDDFRVTPKLTLNLGLRWEYATPLYERSNNYSNFDPATLSMVQASPGSIENRSLVNPDYRDFGPRLGLAYSVDSKTVVRAGYGISYAFFNRVGSALEGINAPQALFGVINQSIPAGGPVPASFLTTQNSFTTGIDNPSAFNPANSNVVYLPPNSRWPYIQNWFLSVQRELTQDTLIEVSYNGNHSLRLPIIADYNEATPNLPGGTLGVQAREPIPSFGPITWVDPAGDDDYNGLSVRFEHRFSHGLYFLNSFTWGKGLGDSEQALEYFSGYVEANPQNIHDLAAERGPSSYDVKFNNVSSIVYELPFGKGRDFASNVNPVVDAVIGGWELNTINTAHTGQPLNVYYSPSSAYAVSGLSNDYRGEPFLRPNVSGSGASQSTAQMLNTYFAGYTFTIPPSVTNPFGDLGRNAFRAPGFEQWDFAVDKNFRIHEDIRVQFRSEFFNLLNNVNFGIPNTQSNSTSFGEIRTTYPARQIQFALKLLF
ncbi:MAG TPA: TonB-dependent receptor [Bryobacteraceae bacterium]|nr:TonB-dependent receptor [Bryobacteraceae bacterium]